jgi:NADPH:quinone reductase-like Zn-dependent oxidoreductase
MTPHAYHLDALHDLAGIVRKPQDIPTPGPDQVVMRVRATSLNRRDLMLLEGTYPVPAAPGVVPLCDGVGEVVAVGDAVTRAREGDRITASYFRHWVDGPQTTALTRQQYGADRDGMLATYAVVEQDSIVHPPASLSDVEAATLTCAAVTAWAALTKPGPVGTVRAGDTVLTVGTGSVALFGMQFARALGARVIAVTSSPEKAERLRALGVAETIDRNATPDWAARVVELTDGAGAQHVLDAVGAPTLAPSAAAAAFNAQITQVGVFSADADPTLRELFAGKYLSIRRIAVGSRVEFEQMNRIIAEHGLRPVIDRTFDFADAVAAYRYYRDADPFGKVVVTV